MDCEQCRQGSPGGSWAAWGAGLGGSALFFSVQAPPRPSGCIEGALLAHGAHSAVKKSIIHFRAKLLPGTNGFIIIQKQCQENIKLCRWKQTEPVLPGPSSGGRDLFQLLPQEGGASSSSFLTGAGPLPAPSSGGRDCKPRAQAHGSHRRAATRARVHGSPASFTTATLRPGAVGCEELCAAWGPRPSLILTWTRWREPILG